MTHKLTTLFLLAACTGEPLDHVPDEPEPETLQPAPVAALDIDLDARIAASSAIAHGTIAKLEYRVTPDGPLAGVPRTRVTLNVTTGLKRARIGEPITLEFLGGLAPDGRVVIASEKPMFDVGDEVVWFVGPHLANGCPLVGCRDGVIRFSSGAAYDAEGHGLFLDGGVLRRGAREAIPEATAFRVGNQTFHRGGEVSGDIDRIDTRAPLTRTQLLGWLTTRI